MIPLRDENPTHRFPLVTLALIAACVGIYFIVQPTGKATFRTVDPAQQQIDDIRFTLGNAAIPCEVSSGDPLSGQEIEQTFRDGDTSACNRDDGGAPQPFPHKRIYLAMVYSMFLHGGFLHLAGNMLFLWVFGNNIEDHRGKIPYLGFYLVSGLVATAAHILIDPNSTVPVVGASGAVAGVMGAYLVLYPNAQIRTLFLWFFILIRDVSAKWLLLIWFVSQFFLTTGSGVAWMAHVGGFVFGVLAGLLWRATHRDEDPDPIRRFSY